MGEEAIRNMFLARRMDAVIPRVSGFRFPGEVMPPLLRKVDGESEREEPSDSNGRRWEAVVVAVA